MADSILRLKVDSNEYDAKLKRAAQGLVALDDKVRSMGATFAYAEKEDVAFVQAIGKMETVARTSKGKLAELNSTITELSVRYKNLSDEEKKSPFGQALKGSIDQLSGRYKDLQGKIRESTEEMKGQSSILDTLSSKFGVNVKSLTGWGAAMAAVTAAAKVAKDAFMNNEVTLDAWGRTVETSKSLYKGFLDSLNGGSIGGFLSKMDDIVRAAGDAYNAMDALGTYNAFNQINVERTRTDYANAVADYREGIGSKDAVQAALKAMNAELSSRGNKEQQAYEAAVNKLAAERGVSGENLLKALSGSYGDYETLKNTPLTGISERPSYGGGWLGRTSYIEVSVPSNEIEELGAALRAINDTEIKDLQALGAQAQRTSTEIANNERAAARILGGRRTGGGGSSTSSSTSTPFVPMLGSMSGIGGGAEGLTFAESLELPEGLSSQIDEITQSLAENQIQLNANALATQQWAEAYNIVASSVGTIGGALKNIEDPAAKVAGTVLQAVATMALSYAEASAKAADLGPIAWAAFAATGLAELITSVTSIKSLAQYAEGGLIGGSMFSGDTQIARVNSGEMVINQTDQRKLYDAIHAGSIGDGAGQQTVISGEQLFVILNAYGRRTGRGELMFR